MIASKCGGRHVPWRPPVTASFIDRETELARLREQANKDDSRMVLVTGRRRIGKTYLLQHCWSDRPVFHFTASNITAAQNRQALLDEAGRWAGETLRPEDYPTWRTALRALLQLHPDERVVFVLDEMQYLAQDPRDLSSFVSELNAVWEGELRREAPILLALSGSAISTLEGLTEGDAALHGRISWHGRLKPFRYHQAARMLPGYSRAEQVEAFGAFGGTPRYLDEVDTDRPVEENIVRHLLAPDGVVRGQIETAIDQELGLRDVSTYRGILAAVGQGRPTGGEIASAIGSSYDTPLRKKMERLIRLEYLERIRNFGAARNQPYSYRLSDFAFRFYYGLVVPNESAIETAGAGSVWKDRLARDAWPTYMGQHVFEDVVRQAYLQLQDDRDVPIVSEWGYWQGQSPNGEAVEIDAVCRLLDGRMMTGSVKYRSRPASASVWTDHVQKLTQLRGSGRKWVHEALKPDAPFLFVSRSGFTDSFHEVRREHPERPVIAWALEDLFG